MGCGLQLGTWKEDLICIICKITWKKRQNYMQSNMLNMSNKSWVICIICKICTNICKIICMQYYIQKNMDNMQNMYYNMQYICNKICNKTCKVVCAIYEKNMENILNDMGIVLHKNNMQNLQNMYRICKIYDSIPKSNMQNMNSRLCWCVYEIL
jgi:hypothetical protein